MADMSFKLLSFAFLNCYEHCHCFIVICLNKNQARLLAIDLFLHFDANHDNTLDADELRKVAQFLHCRNPDVVSSVMEKQTMTMEDLVTLITN